MEQKRSAVKGFPLVHGAPLRIHYRNPELEERYADLWLWCWDAWDEERDIPAAGADDFGAVFELPRGALNQVGKRRPSLGFKVKDGQGADGVTWYEFDRRWRRRDGWEVFVTAGDPALHPSAQEALRPQALLRLEGAAVFAAAIALYAHLGGSGLAFALLLFVPSKEKEPCTTPSGTNSAFPCC